MLTGVMMFRFIFARIHLGTHTEREYALLFRS